MITSSEGDSFINTILNGQSLLEDAIAHIANNHHPSDVFDKIDLEEWALDNGFIRGVEDD